MATPDRFFEVVESGPLATIQDLGRRGLGALGVGHAGPADVPSMRLANRILGNPEGEAAIEVTFGGLEVRSHGGMFVALTGAPCPVEVAGRAEGPNSVIWVPDGATLRVGVPTSGLRSYLAVRGGIAVAAHLESRATDTLAALGPAPLATDDRLPVGDAPLGPVLVDLVTPAPPAADEVVLRIHPGPRADWFTPDAHAALVGESYEVSPDSNRVGMRLTGPVLERVRDRELASEGMVCGALQVPHTGLPTVFLADHPVTGGYPVIAVVAHADLPKAAQARPGQRLRFTWVS